MFALQANFLLIPTQREGKSSHKEVRSSVTTVPGWILSRFLNPRRLMSQAQSPY